MKKIITFSLVICLLFAAPISASMKTHWIKASGKYDINELTSKKSFKEKVKYSDLSKKQKKEALRLYNKDPRKLYKKYGKKLFFYGAVKTKLKNNTYTVWGKFTRKSSSGKKKYKFGKYKFKLSKKAVLIAYGYYGEGTGSNSKIFRGASLRKVLKNPPQVGYEFFVSNGKIYKIEGSP